MFSHVFPTSETKTKGDTIEILTYSKDGKFTLEVRDTGIGISDEAITHIFDRFI